MPPEDSSVQSPVVDRALAAGGYPQVFLDRGRDLVDADNVSEVEVETAVGGSGFQVNCACDDGAREAFRVTVRVGVNVLGQTLVDGECSCPLGGGCRHEVAALLAVPRRLLPEVGPIVQVEPNPPEKSDLEAPASSPAQPPGDDQDQLWFSDLEQTGNDWFEVKFAVTLGGKEIDLLPALACALEAGVSPDDPAAEVRVAVPGGGTLSLPASDLAMPLRFLHQLFGSVDPEEVGVHLEDGLRVHALQAAELAAEPHCREVRGKAGARCPDLASLALGLREAWGGGDSSPAEGFGTELRPYQRAGLAWFRRLAEFGLGGVMADDMGLGKTVQVLAHLHAEKASGRAGGPSLVVAPTSVVPSWARESARFAPSLNVLVLQGEGRGSKFAHIPDFDLILTSYALVHRDADKLAAYDYHAVILDEAQHVKNPRSKAAGAVRELVAEQRICLTGTPVENHLGELWSLYDFLMPGFLGGEGFFRESFRKPIEEERDAARLEVLAKRIAPVMLRRTKAEVATELPPKTEIVQLVQLTEDQKTLYESVRASMDERVREAMAERGVAGSKIVVLDALLKLRQICCHPRLLKQEAARAVGRSAKLDRLLEIVPEVVESGGRVLLFSQFTSMLDLIADELREAEIDFLTLTGSSKDRGGLVEKFQSGAASVFLLSLKAAATGLTLTAADTVIHYDPWWNPAVEEQASDRAYRIGQTKPVFIHRMICEGSVEERIRALQGRKAEIAAAILGEAESGGEVAGGLSELSPSDIAGLFAPLGV